MGYPGRIEFTTAVISIANPSRGHRADGIGADISHSACGEPRVDLCDSHFDAALAIAVVYVQLQ